MTTFFSRYLHPNQLNTFIMKSANYFKALHLCEQLFKNGNLPEAIWVAKLEEYESVLSKLPEDLKAEVKQHEFDLVCDIVERV